MFSRKLTFVLVLATSATGCVDALDGPQLDHRTSEVQLDPLYEHFQLVQDKSRASRATGSLEVPILADGKLQTVPSKQPPPFPPWYNVRGTCGVTFISPHYAITAAHCVSGANLPNPTSVFPVYTYDITGVVETWQLEFTAFNQGAFPDYEPLGGGNTAADVPGYTRVFHGCRLTARCSDFFGPRYNCGSMDADIALINCVRGREEVAEWLPVAKDDPETGPVEMYWFHELLSMPTTWPASGDPDQVDRWKHYTILGSEADNFHYLDSRYNALLPFKSVPWPDGTPRTRRAYDPFETATDLFGCHGTSGSGVLQFGADGELELLGPVQHGGFGDDLCTDPANFHPENKNVTYTRNVYTRQLEALFQTVLDADRGI